MSNFKLNRRKFISSSGLVLMLPALEEFFPRAHAQTNDPRRFVTFYFPNGTYNQKYGANLPAWCAAANGALTDNVGAAFTPFLQYKSDFSLINNWKWREATDHRSAPLCYLSSDTSVYKSSIKAGESTFDHMHAASTGRAPIILYGGTIGHDGWGFISYKNGQETLGLTNPGDLYRQLLTAIAPSASLNSSQFQPRAATGSLARSILDNSIADINDLKSKLGRSSRMRLDEFLTSIRELETKLGNSPSTSPGPAPTPFPSPTPMPGPSPIAGCERPQALAAGVDTGKDPGSSPTAYFDRFKAFNDLIRIAFACDVTRTVTIMFDRETAERTLTAPTELVYRNGQIKGYYAHTGGIAHSLAAYPGPEDVAIDRNITRDRVLLSLVFDLVGKLKATKDVSGSSILDNTIIYGGHGVEHGAHANMSYNDVAVGNPALIAGGRNFMPTGRGIDGKQFKRLDLLYTFSSLLGMNLPNFGGSTKLVTF